MFCTYCGNGLAELPPTQCKTCGEPHWLNPKPSASALIVNDDAVLLVQRANDPWRGGWDIPGGFCNPAEHPEATAIREAKEEVGLDIEIVGFLGIWTDVYPNQTANSSDRPAETTLNIYYLARTDQPEQHKVNPSEVSQTRYFNYWQLPETLAFPDQLVPVLNAWRTTVTDTGSESGPGLQNSAAAGSVLQTHSRGLIT